MASSLSSPWRIAVVIPCYRVKAHILDVLASIGKEAERIYVIDDACPEGSGAHVQAQVNDPRVRVLFHASNQGVGGATVTGYRQALADGADIIVKLDGDGQMDASLMPLFIQPIIDRQADYTKGNRFYHLEDAKAMPLSRLFGNALLSFITKFSSGYWDSVDPANGYTALAAPVAQRPPMHKLSKGYFFESDLLFRLNTIGAVVVDIPMKARYGNEISNLSILRNLLPFLAGNIRNYAKRVFYHYFLRHVSIATFELVFGLALTLFGLITGLSAWRQSDATGIPSPAGTVMLSALPILIGFQLLLAFLSADIASTPKTPLIRRLGQWPEAR